MTAPLYIFDLDGTLANIEHRKHFVERPAGAKKDWDAFYAACEHDAVNLPVVRTFNQLTLAGAECWVFSGRGEVVREQTVAWLARHTMSSWYWRDEGQFRLTMRPDKDYTPDDMLKERWLYSMLNVDRKRLVAVFDDRDKVVAMWRRNGIACFQVAEGKF